MLYNNTLTSNKPRQTQFILTKPTSQSNRYNKAQPLHNYLTLDFKQDNSTFVRFRINKLQESHHKQPNTFVKTFYNKQSPRTQRKKYVKSSNGRSTSFSYRDSVIGTPFGSLQLNDPEQQKSVFPSLDDVQRYRYLLKAILSISKTKKLPQFREKTLVNKAKDKVRQNALSPVNEKGQNIIASTPKVIKLQIGFQDHGSPFGKANCQNAFQKMFKNKRLLQKGRHQASKSDYRENYSLGLLGEEDLLISQMAKQPRRPKQTLFV